jgi:predicted phosphodiesterase
MTRVLVLSDLHIEFGPLAVPQIDVDLVILAGDIHVGPASPAWAEKLARRLGAPVVLVAGNHEHYGSARQAKGGIERTIEAYRAASAASDGRLFVLERESVEVAGCTVVGATLWSDFALFGADRVAAAMQAAADEMNDFQLIAWRRGMRFAPAHARAEFERAEAFLESEIAKPRRAPLIVVTHHSPSFRSVPARFAKDLLSAAYSSHLDDLVERSGAAVWVHGHTHDSFDYTIGGTRVICNPRGYYGRELNRNFNPQLVIEIGDGLAAERPSEPLVDKPDKRH